jgi:hypothetical protein
MDLDFIPNTPGPVWIHAAKVLDNLSVPGLYNQQASNRRLAIVRYNGTRGHDADSLGFGAIEVGSMLAEMFCTGLEAVRLIEGMNYEEHCPPPVRIAGVFTAPS